MFALQTVSARQIPTSITGRYFFSIMFLFTVIVTSSYSSSYSSIMTIPRYERAINTVKDFSESGLHWGATQDAWITSIQRTDDVYCKINQLNNNNNNVS